MRVSTSGCGIRVLLVQATAATTRLLVPARLSVRVLDSSGGQLVVFVTTGAIHCALRAQMSSQRVFIGAASGG
jgi:hypothetical protein